jgi:hypothetical protein
MMFDKFVSNNLRAALRDHGWAKLAHQVIYAKGGFPPEDTTVQSGAKALCMKLAVDMVNHRTIREGVVALKELRRGE